MKSHLHTPVCLSYLLWESESALTRRCLVDLSVSMCLSRVKACLALPCLAFIEQHRENQREGVVLYGNLNGVLQRSKTQTPRHPSSIAVQQVIALCWSQHLWWVSIFRRLLSTSVFFCLLQMSIRTRGYYSGQGSRRACKMAAMH